MKISTEDMYEALERSGYLLEATIAEKLSSLGFFVQANQVIEDPITGKARELDIIAEYFGDNSFDPDLRACSKIEYVIEVKNNKFPVLLLSEFRPNPNVEEWTGLKEIFTVPDDVDYSLMDSSYYDALIDSNEHVFTQYCSFDIKKGKQQELMALHPEAMHTGISKIVQYCEEQQEFWDTRAAEGEDFKYFRHFLYMPVLLVKDSLYELIDGEIVEVERSTLIINYYHNREPKLAHIQVVTEAGLDDFINSCRSIESEALTRMKSALLKK